MAIYHCSMKSFGRSAGKSATGAAAYRAGIAIADERTGVTHDYTRRKGVEAVLMLAPAHAPAWAADPVSLWNAAEAKENRSNSVVAREFEIALPHELTDDQREALARNIGQDLVDRFGFALQIAIHSPDDGGKNWHAHMLATTRKMGPEGLTEKTRELDQIRDTAALDWVRAMVADRTNHHLAQAGLSARVDHRSLDAQAMDAIERGDMDQARALDRLPTVKEGRNADAPVRKARNVRIKTLNSAGQARWDRMAKSAAAEARLMPAASDARTPSTSLSRKPHDQIRSRPRADTLTPDYVRSARLRSARSRGELVLTVPARHGAPVVEPGRAAKRGNSPLRANEPGHRNLGAPLHGSSGSAKPSSGVARQRSAAPSQTVRPAASRPLTGQAAKSWVGGAATRARASGGDAIGRMAIQLINERNQLQEEAVRWMAEKDAEFRAAMARADGLRAASWREHDRVALSAKQWLQQHDGEEGRRFARRTDAERAVALARARRDKWMTEHPQPAQRWLRQNQAQRDAWEQERRRNQRPVNVAKDIYARAVEDADIPALRRLEMARETKERELARAENMRQAIERLPSEISQARADEQERMEFVQAAQERQAGEDAVWGENPGQNMPALHRWKHSQPRQPKPPGD